MRCREPKTRPEKLATALAEIQSCSRLDAQGGYPDDWALYDDVILVASVDHDGGPTLSVSSVAEYITESLHWIEEDEQNLELYHQCLADPVFKRQITAAKRRLARRHREQVRRDAVWREGYLKKHPPPAADAAPT